MPIMDQWWRDICFVHWRVDPALVSSWMPAGVRVDTFDSSAWIGLIPFRMCDAGFGQNTPVPYFGSFLELNVRTYSVDDRGNHGVVFCSLDAERAAVCAAARLGFAVPYWWATMSLQRESGGALTYCSKRRWPGAPVVTRMTVTPGAGLTEPSSLQHFLTARYGLHTRYVGRTWWVPNRHEPWPLCDARLGELSDGLVAAAGVPGVAGVRPPDSVLFSPGVRTTFHRPVCL